MGYGRFGKSLSIAAFIAMQSINKNLMGDIFGTGKLAVKHGSGVPKQPKKPKFTKSGDIVPTARNLMPLNEEEKKNLAGLRRGFGKKMYVLYLKTKYNFPRPCDAELVALDIQSKTVLVTRSYYV